MRYFDTGPLPIHLGVCIDEKAFKKEMKRLNIDSYPKFVSDGATATTHTYTKTDSYDNVIICINPRLIKTSSKVELCGVCAHEATHFMQSAVEAMRDSNPSQEMQAYIVQWCTQLLLQECGKVRKL